MCTSLCQEQQLHFSFALGLVKQKRPRELHRTRAPWPGRYADLEEPHKRAEAGRTPSLEDPLQFFLF